MKLIQRGNVLPFLKILYFRKIFEIFRPNLKIINLFFRMTAFILNNQKVN